MATVEVLTSEVVVPAEETPGGAIWLSNLDLAGRRGYTPTVYFFRPNGEQGFFAADAMKESLARALVAFYPLAGRLGFDGNGRIQVNCTGEGVVFVTARSDYVLDDPMNDFVPCNGMRDLLVPPTPAPNPPCVLLFVQVTYLRCGGVVLGQAMHHSIVDARGAAHFFETWASIARGATVNVQPCFDHTLLSARPARAVLYDHPEYKPEPEPVDAIAASTYASATITMTKGSIPNGLGVMFAVAQLILYAIYYRSTQQIIEARNRKADQVAMTEVVVDATAKDTNSGAGADHY